MSETKMRIMCILLTLISLCGQVAVAGDMDWKIFHEINFVDHNYKKFDASKWPLTPSGLLGPVRLTSMKKHLPE